MHFYNLFAQAHDCVPEDFRNSGSRSRYNLFGHRAANDWVLDVSTDIIRTTDYITRFKINGKSQNCPKLKKIVLKIEK